MTNILLRILVSFLPLLTHSLFAFTGTIKYSKEFYAAQKYFYNEAKNKFPKLVKEKFYPEVPLRGAASNEELKAIMPLMDFYEARRIFSEEINKYPEQLYPEIFAFLNAHPALKVSASNKLKFEALENYFLPFNYALCNDKYYYFHPETKTHPCPLVFYYSDDKKNSFTVNLANASKKNLALNLNEGQMQDYISYTGKKPMPLKGGSSSSVKLTVNLGKLKTDSVFKVLNLVFSDPAQPKIKLVMPVVLLPSKDFMNLPAHFFALNYTYNTHAKNIDLFKDRTSGPEPCSGNNCSGEKHYTLRSADRSNTEYAFGELGLVQFNLWSQSPPVYSSKTNVLQINFNELGYLNGVDRNCPGAVQGSSAPCPPETPSNGKQLYGSRKIEMKIFIPAGKRYDLRVMLNYNDLKTQLLAYPELSWLQDKKLVLVLSDETKKILHKEFSVNNLIATQKKDLEPGIYTLAIYPVNEDSNKLNPSFELNYLNRGGKARFDFSLKSTFTLLPSK